MGRSHQTDPIGLHAVNIQGKGQTQALIGVGTLVPGPYGSLGSFCISFLGLFWRVPSWSSPRKTWILQLVLLSWGFL